MHTLKQLISESTSRYCSLYMASNGKWYLELAPLEYGEQEDAQAYGPFSSYNETIDYLDNFSNPGGWDEDDSGRRPPPTMSPNGHRVQSPSGSGSSSGYGMSGLRSFHRHHRTLSGIELKNRIADMISDFGDEHGWDRTPSVQNIMDDIADETRKSGADYDSKQARKFAEEALGVTPPAPTPRKADVPRPPPPKKGPAPGGKLKATYKIYGAHHDAQLGTSPLHTRIKGKVYIPTQASKFKKGDEAEIAVEPGGKKLSVKKPDSDHTQTWTAKESFELLIHDLVKLMHG